MDNPAIREFDEIRPYEPGEMRQAFNELIYHGCQKVYVMAF